MDLLKTIIGLLTGSAGTALGGAVSQISQWLAVAGVAGGAFLWLYAHGDEQAFSYTYKQAAVLVAIVGLVLFLVVRLVHRAPPP